MNKESLIGFCRHYKGETVNPFAHDKDPNKQMMWETERGWVQDSLLFSEQGISTFGEQLYAYTSCGLSSFNAYDVIPITYKAYLFDRIAKTCNSRMDAVPCFKDMYERFYGK